MRTLLIFAALVAFTSGIFVNQLKKFRTVDVGQHDNQQVLSEDTKSQTIETLEESEKQNEGEEVILNSPTSTIPIITPTYISPFMDNFIYPNAKIMERLANRLTMESSDTAEIITNWYKEEIKKEGMNVRTFVVTKANEKILNKLVGAEGSREVLIEISKEQADELVRIVVDVSL